MTAQEKRVCYCDKELCHVKCMHAVPRVYIGYSVVHKVICAWLYSIQRFSGRLKLHVYGVKLQVEVQSAMTTNYIDAAVYMFCISGHG